MKVKHQRAIGSLLYELTMNCDIPPSDKLSYANGIGQAMRDAKPENVWPAIQDMLAGDQRRPHTASPAIMEQIGNRIRTRAYAAGLLIMHLETHGYWEGEYTS